MRTQALLVLLAVGLLGCGDEVVGYRTSVTDGFAEDPFPRFAAGGFDLRRIVSFDDGQTWEAEGVEPAPPMDSEVTGIARGPGQIVMVAGETTLVSDDGSAWESFGDRQGYMRAVAYGGGRFVSVGHGGRRSYSEDGWGWINRPDTTDGADYQAVAYGNGRFVAVGLDQMATSTDGETWETTPLPGSKLVTIAYGEGRFLALGEEGRVVITRDGRSLEYDAMGPYLMDACFLDGQWVALGSNTVWTSADGVDWAEFSHGREIYTLACGDGVLVGAGYDRLYRAEDPTSWEEVGQVDGDLTRVRFTGL